MNIFYILQTIQKLKAAMDTLICSHNVQTINRINHRYLDNSVIRLEDENE